MNLILVLLLVGVVSASFDVGNVSHSIETSYAPGGEIKGWINISLEGEPVDSFFEDGEEIL